MMALRGERSEGFRGSRPYGGASREGSSDRWAKAILGTASAVMFAAAPFAYNQLESDSLICKDGGSWSMRFCGPNGETSDQPVTTADSNGTPQKGGTPNSEPSISPTAEQTPSAKGGTPGEGTSTPSVVINPCEGVPTYTDLTLIINQDGEHVSTTQHRVQP